MLSRQPREKARFDAGGKLRVRRLAMCVATAGLFSLAGTAQSAVLISDDFSAPDGNLEGTTPDVGGVWTKNQGDNTNPVDIVSNAAVIKHSSVSAADDDVNSGFAGGAINSGTLFYGFEFSVADPGVAFGSDFESFAGFLIDAAGSSNANNQARMDIVGPAGAGDFSVGISDGGTSNATWATDLTFDTVYRAIVRYDFADGISTLWIDPTSEGDAGIVSDASIVTELQAFVFRQSISSQGETITVDNLLVATTFAEVLSGAPARVGDLDGDGFVGIADLNIVLGLWNQNVTAGDKLSGDPSGDGFVGIEDLNTVLGNWNAGTPPANGAAVPEPATLALLGGGVLALCRRRIN